MQLQVSQEASNESAIQVSSSGKCQCVSTIGALETLQENEEVVMMTSS